MRRVSLRKSISQNGRRVEVLRRMYVVFDSCSGVHDNPFPAHTDNDAIRRLRNSLTEPNHPIAMSPADFHMKFIGIFDDSTGRFEPADVCEVIVSAIDLLTESDDA